MSSAQGGMHPGTYLPRPSTSGAPVTQGTHQPLAQSRSQGGKQGQSSEGAPLSREVPEWGRAGW